MGFSAEAPMEKIFRDVRVSRIYEGTNEINRMLIVRMIFKKFVSKFFNQLKSKDYSELDAVDHYDKLKELQKN